MRDEITVGTFGGEPCFNAKVGGFNMAFDTREEAELAIALWKVGGEKVGYNSFVHLYSGILRMMGAGDTNWAGLKGDK